MGRRQHGGANLRVRVNQDGNRKAHYNGEAFKKWPFGMNSLSIIFQTTMTAATFSPEVKGGGEEDITVTIGEKGLNPSEIRKPV